MIFFNQGTVPLKGKLTVSTRFSKLDSRVAKVETFEFRESRNEEFWNIHELEFVRELAIHLSKKDNNYVTQFSVLAHVPSKKALFVTLRYTMVLLRFASNILPESKRHESKHLKKTNSNSAPLLKLLHLKHELFLFVLQSTRKMIGFKQTSNNSRNTVDMIRTMMEILVRVRLLFQSPCEVFLFNTYPYCS